MSEIKARNKIKIIWRKWKKFLIKYIDSDFDNENIVKFILTLRSVNPGRNGYLYINI